MKALASHVGGLWGRLWILPLVPTLYAMVLYSIGDLRLEHVVFAGLSAVFGLYGARSKQFFVDVWPYIAVAFGYDLVRYARPIFVSPERVLGCSLRDAELALFSVSKGVTLQDYFSVHHHPAFDLLFAVPYTIFPLRDLRVRRVPVLRRSPSSARVRVLVHDRETTCRSRPGSLFPPRRPGTCERTAASSTPRWCRAPPLWRESTRCSASNTLPASTSRASSVFGALPSMHCAYPMIGLLAAWHVSGWKTRPIHFFYVILMACAAVYLDHHWLIDVVAGWTTAGIAVFLSTRIVNRFYSEAPAPVVAPPNRALVSSG